ncbi:hypothetical protein PCANC_22859 [Puccinia coronata f. sp. avenae]|uniref:Uncharacterized protein n=1 Tax=Puccinia coronata f. sp. avenae TaxID=200324 RepID=A0A2N5U727_9BASI|nr:hypothetical protein PCANC_22859 [Puccinia coronata f. sp. avenae]
MAPIRQCQGGKQYVPYENSFESSYLHAQYHREPVEYSNHDTNVIQLVGQRQMSLPQQSPSASSTAVNRPSDYEIPLLSNNCQKREELHRVPGDLSSSRPSSASGASPAPPASCASGASTTTPATVAAAAASSSTNSDCSKASPNPDGTRYWTPAMHIASRCAESVPSPTLLLADRLLRETEVLPPAATSMPLHPPLRALPARCKPGEPPVPEELEKAHQSNHLHDADEEFLPA